jgi:hypothetical protein
MLIIDISILHSNQYMLLCHICYDNNSNDYNVANMLLYFGVVEEYAV